MTDYSTTHGIRIAKEFTPETFGRLTTIGPKFALPDNAKGHRKWFQVCQCACGLVVIVSTQRLVNSNTKSCGCLKAITNASRSTTHGRTYTPEHVSWLAMRQRCRYPKAQNYASYGGIGISVHPDWDNAVGGFQNFLDYIGLKPTPRHEIDRYPNKKGNYEPGNVRWATRIEQNRNRKTNINVTYNGKTQCLSAWAKELGVKYSTVHARIGRGWEPIVALLKGLED